jgi:hypothetical protein
MKTSIKNLTNATTDTTVASVATAKKTIAKAKAPKQNHIFAADGVTRVTAEDKAMLDGLKGDVQANSTAALAFGAQAITMKSRAASLWTIFGGSTVTSSMIFAKLITDGYLDAATVSGATAPSGIKNPEKRAVAQLAWETNRALFGVNKHPLFTALDATSPSAVANAAKLKVITPKGEAKKVASESTANLTDAVDVVASDVHVAATVTTFMASKPTDLARKALLESVAKLLGFELQGFKSIKAAK